jgi:hypothetical protein
MGCNAYRTSHHPVSRELLDACDRFGMLVMDETRLMSTGNEDRAIFVQMIKNDRNHPSVIMWSIGNEEHMGAAAAIISAYCALSVLWSRIFLKEKLSLKHYISIFIAFAGIIMLGFFDA